MDKLNDDRDNVCFGNDPLMTDPPGGGIIPEDQVNNASTFGIDPANNLADEDEAINDPLVDLEPQIDAVIVENVEDHFVSPNRSVIVRRSS